MVEADYSESFGCLDRTSFNEFVFRNSTNFPGWYAHKSSDASNYTWPCIQDSLLSRNPNFTFSG